ncbi:hypothetical protein CVT24_006940 [Panaeolus cyanescens]|uniref:Uncharacterized protein n=1 Tax=Panaeolus cyanescens TaxID=181874 RepID=A0A409W031_9AGAR|nr:hypothetical protein CVT24_006940 [Panaeolus cyanescens]
MDLASSLPAEILSAIFRLVVQQKWNSDRIKGAPFKPPCIYLLHVCQYWRAIALNDSSLWSRIDSFGSAWCDMHLERSKNVDLHCQLPRSDNAFNSQVFDRVMKVLGQAHRLRSFTYSQGFSPFQFLLFRRTCPVLEKLFVTEFPALESLTIDIDDRDEFSHRPNIPLGLSKENLPQLKRLTLRGFDISWTSPLLSGLTSLRLEADPSHKCIGTLGQVLDRLERMPLLENLRLRWSGDGLGAIYNVQSSRIIPLPHLKNIFLDISVREAVNLVSHLSYPPSVAIRLQADACGPETDGFWFNDQEIRHFMIPDVASFLGSSLAFQPRVATIYSNSSNSTSPSSPVRTAEIGTHYLDSAYQNPYIVLRTWSDPLDFTMYPHPSSHFLPSKTDNSIPPPSVFITFRVEKYGPDLELIRGHLLPILPVSDLQSIALDQEIPSSGFQMLGALPHLRIMAMKGSSFFSFFNYLLREYGTKEDSNADVENPNDMDDDEDLSDTDDEDSNDTDGEESSDADDEDSSDADVEDSSPTHTHPFSSLVSLSLEEVTFWDSKPDPPPTSPHVINTIVFLSFLRWRKVVLGFPIQRIRFSKCDGLSDDDIEDIREWVPDVKWDGVFKRDAFKGHFAPDSDDEEDDTF